MAERVEINAWELNYAISFFEEREALLRGPIVAFNSEQKSATEIAAKAASAERLADNYRLAAIALKYLRDNLRRASDG